MKTIAELLDLIRRGGGVPSTISLTVHHTRESWDFSGWVIHPTMLLYIDAFGLTVHRTADSVHALRDGTDVLRGAGSARWVFEGLDVPALVDAADLNVLGGVRYFLNPVTVIKTMNLIDTDLRQLAAGEIAGRATWVIPSAAHSYLDDEHHPKLIEVDQHNGVLLAMESDHERIEASTVSFPSTLPDPTWGGEFTDWYAEVTGSDDPVDFPEDIPGSFTTLPPQPDDPRCLRIWIGNGSLEGAYPQYTVGESVRLPLAFRRDSPPLPGLETTRRGWIQHLGDPLPDPRWPVFFTGDGWSAYSHISSPLHMEAELDGWFDYSAWDPEQVLNDVRVERIFGAVGGLGDPRRLWQELNDTADAYREGDIWLLDVILDVTLDGAVPPPLTVEQFQFGDAHVTDDHLWVSDYRLPVLRSWRISTGHYLGQSFVPVSLHTNYGFSFSGDVIHNDKQAWSLIPGAPALSPAASWDLPREAAEAAPEIPAPWEVMQHFPGGLYSLSALTDPGSRIALGRINAQSGMDICPVHTGGLSIAQATRVGDRYFLDCWQLGVVIGPDFRVESVDHHNMQEPSWSWSADRGIAVNSAGPELVFVHQDSGEEITRWTKPEGHSIRVNIIAPDTFMVILCPSGADAWLRPAPTALALFEKDHWRVVVLEATNPEI